MYIFIFKSYLAAGVAENDSLSNRQGVIQITQRLQFPILQFNWNVELLNTFQGELEFIQIALLENRHNIGKQ